ncbi:MAG: hypothetical protein JXQ75_06750, partial [Phycisphaerae bacterium]|nr:hypothetical protein [Phycisphaerae bacterium]
CVVPSPCPDIVTTRPNDNYKIVLSKISQMYGRSDAGLRRDLEQFKAHVEGGKAGLANVWQDEGNWFYTRPVQPFIIGFTKEVICKPKTEGVLPKSTKYGVVMTSRHLADDYWLMLLKD